jgi:hypothetical protein
MGVLERFRPRIGASEFAGIFRGSVAALRSKEECPGSFGEMLGRWGVTETDSDALAAGFRTRAGAFLAAGAAFSIPLAAGGSDVLWALPMVPAVLGASLDAWRADMLEHRRWRHFWSYLAGFMVPGGGWGPEEGTFGVTSGDAFGVTSGDAFGVASGDAFGVASGDAFGVISGDAFGVISGDAFGVTSGDAFGVADVGGFGGAAGDA